MIRYAISLALLSLDLHLLLLTASATASVADSAQDMLAAGRVDDAIAELNGHLSSAPADAESSNLLCRAYFALEDWDRAESACKKAVSLIPNNSRFPSLAGTGLRRERRIAQIFCPRPASPERSASEFERAVQLNPKDVDARARSGGILR